MIHLKRFGHNDKTTKPNEKKNIFFFTEFLPASQESNILVELVQTKNRTERRVNIGHIVCVARNMTENEC